MHYEFILRVGVALVIGFTAYQKWIFGAEVATWAGSAIFLMINYYKMIKKETDKRILYSKLVVKR